MPDKCRREAPIAPPIATYKRFIIAFVFLISTSAFLILGSFILGERKWHIMLPVAFIATGAVWYLVQEVLGIYMRPLPGIFGG